MDWTDLRSDEVEKWVWSIQDGKRAPVHYPLVAHLATRARLPDLRLDVIARVGVREDSGTLEVDVPLSPAVAENRLARESAVDSVLDLARRVDEREYVRAAPEPLVAAEGRLATLSEWHSRVDDGIDVVGPGGRVTLFLTARGLSADVTVRPRDTARARAARWKDPADVAAAIRERLGGWPREAEVRGAFGYFEASKYERQEWLRPVFLLVVREPRADEAPQRVAGVMEDATEAY